jgi:hypothetical protein
VRHHRDGHLVTICDGCYEPTADDMTVEIEGRVYHRCSDPCEAKVRATYPLPYRSPEEVWDSEARAADVGVIQPEIVVGVGVTDG